MGARRAQWMQRYAAPLPSRRRCAGEQTVPRVFAYAWPPARGSAPRLALALRPLQPRTLVPPRVRACQGFRPGRQACVLLDPNVLWLFLLQAPPKAYRDRNRRRVPAPGLASHPRLPGPAEGRGLSRELGPGKNRLTP